MALVGDWETVLAGRNVDWGQFLGGAGWRNTSRFIHKYGIAQKEARETVYWLCLLAEGAIVPRRRLTPLIKESEEIYAVITAIIRNAKIGSKSQG